MTQKRMNVLDSFSLYLISFVGMTRLSVHHALVNSQCHDPLIPTHKRHGVCHPPDGKSNFDCWYLKGPFFQLGELLLSVVALFL